MHNHSPILCILPPHVLKEIAAKGTESQKKMALDTITASAQLRAERLKMAEFRTEFASATFRAATGGKEGLSTTRRTDQDCRERLSVKKAIRRLPMWESTRRMMEAARRTIFTRISIAATPLTAMG